jgi:hypothetical protein
MGLFDDDTSRKRDEVRIGVSEQEEDTKLKSDVEEKIGKTEKSSSSSSVSLEDIYEQNERIIKLLEKMVGEKNDMGESDSISDRRNTRESTAKDDTGMRGGMDELL